MNLVNTHLWGNVPAYDLIRYDQNEAKVEGFKQKSFDILFAASGDLRIMLETFDSISKMIDKVEQVNIHINDISEMVAVRNLYILYLLITKLDDGIDMAIQLWYSVAITS